MKKLLFWGLLCVVPMGIFALAPADLFTLASNSYGKDANATNKAQFKKIGGVAFKEAGVDASKLAVKNALKVFNDGTDIGTKKVEDILPAPTGTAVDLPWVKTPKVADEVEKVKGDPKKVIDVKVIQGLFGSGDQAYGTSVLKLMTDDGKKELAKRVVA